MSLSSAAGLLCSELASLHAMHEPFVSWVQLTAYVHAKPGWQQLDSDGFAVFRFGQLAHSAQAFCQLRTVDSVCACAPSAMQ